MTRVLVVEDEESFSDALSYMLRKEGFEPVVAGTGPEALAEFDRGGADIVLLDLMLPGLPGTEVCRQLRSRSNVPIIMLTAKDAEVDKVVGLELGADDYMMKPFEPRELLARIRSVIRRVAEPAPPAPEPTAGPEPAEAKDFHDAFWVQTSRGQIRVPVDTIEWIEAAKDYALLHTGERSHMIRVTMSALEGSLDPQRMMRVHRSAFVRPAAVKEISQVGRHMTLVLESGAAVRVGPIHAEEVRHRLRR